MKKEKAETTPTKKATTKTTTEKKTKNSKTESKFSKTKSKKVEKDIVDTIEPVVEETDLDIEDINSFYDEKKAKLDLDGLALLSKETKNSVVYMSKEQVRIITDNYYATQRYRMNITNQIRAVDQGFDDYGDEQPAIAWLLKDIQNRENQIKKLLSEYAKTEPVCQWAMATKGIGPVFAANLWNYIDMSKCHHANQFISYAGLNDQNCPWLGIEKSREMVNEAYEYFGLKSSDPVNDDVLLRVAINSGRTLEKVKRGFNTNREQATKSTTDRTVLIKYLSKSPYNIELKKICYLIGESFVKVSNRDSLYGRIYKERKALETMRNENGEYREQAEKLLAEKNYSKDTDTCKFLSEGKLSPAHINARAKRYAVKFFLTHFFEACWIYKYKTQPPSIYPIAHQGHVDYIGPEVPYSDFFDYK